MLCWLHRLRILRGIPPGNVLQILKYSLHREVLYTLTNFNSAVRRNLYSTRKMAFASPQVTMAALVL